MITSVFFSGMRALPPLEREFSSGITVVCGKNGCGKTTLLEAIFLLSQGFSFRTRKLSELIPWSGENTLLRARFERGEISTKHALLISKTEISVSKDGQKFHYPSSFFGKFPAVIMQPSDLELVRGEPEIRRRWLDELLCLLSPINVETLRNYRRILLQRNEWLREAKKGNSLGGKDVFFALSLQLAALGAKIWEARFLLGEKIGKSIAHYYDMLSESAESITFDYCSAVSSNENFYARFLELLEEKEEAEFRLGFSLVGPHRDDFSLRLSSGYDLRQVGSQGQCRTAALSMRLSSADILAKEKHSPILLLDDILAELDGVRRQAVSRLIREKKSQVLIALPRLEDLPFEPDDILRLS